MMERLREIGSELEIMTENIEEEMRELGLTDDSAIEGDSILHQGQLTSLNDIDLGGCDDVAPGDIVDAELYRLTKDLIDKGMNPDQASDAVFTAMADLIHSDDIKDSPDIDEPANVKAIWVNNSIPKIRELLIERGLV